jgi:hypothetical protein
VATIRNQKASSHRLETVWHCQRTGD